MTAPRSIRYRELERSIREIRRALLPAKFSPTGVYRNPKRMHLRTASFRVLCHAEIETYLEDRAKEVFDSAVARWDSSRTAGVTVLSLIAFCEAITQLPPSKLGGDPANQKAYEDVSTPLGKARGRWTTARQRNHGIKEKNVLRLFLPLGLPADQLDPALLVSLDDFGGDRGAVAHGSSRRVTTYLDPRTEETRIRDLVTQLRGLDDAINSLLAC